MVPKPVLSTNCSSLTSKITLGLAVSTGAMPRLNTGDWLASSLGPGTVIIVTSPYLADSWFHHSILPCTRSRMVTVR